MSLNFILFGIGGMLIIAGIVSAIFAKKVALSTGEKKKTAGYKLLRDQMAAL